MASRTGRPTSSLKGGQTAERLKQALAVIAVGFAVFMTALSLIEALAAWATRL
jgi:hypothetical protein